MTSSKLQHQETTSSWIQAWYKSSPLFEDLSIAWCGGSDQVNMEEKNDDDDENSIIERQEASSSPSNSTIYTVPSRGYFDKFHEQSQQQEGRQIPIWSCGRNDGEPDVYISTQNNDPGLAMASSSVALQTNDESSKSPSSSSYKSDDTTQYRCLIRLKPDKNYNPQQKLVYDQAKEQHRAVRRVRSEACIDLPFVAKSE
jgi:hypothetical protein